MTLPLLAERLTLRRMHQAVERNIQRNHRQARHESTKPSSGVSPQPAPGASAGASPPAGKPPPIPSPLLRQNTIPGPAWAWIDPLLTPFRAYGRMQARSPLMTQLESTMIIYYLGDLSAQTVQTAGFADGQYEPLRGLRAILIGAGASIPGYRWFIWLGRNFNYSSHAASLAVKIVVNQCVFTPCLNSYFFGMQTLLAGGGLAEAKERIINTVPVTWKNSWKLWPAVTAFSFTFVPWQYRNVFAGVIAIGWQTYLSWLNRTEEHREEVERKDLARIEDQRAQEAAAQKAQAALEKKKKKKARRAVEEQEE